MRTLTEEQKKDIAHRVREIVREQLPDVPPIGDNDRLHSDLGADSLDIQELALSLEEEFNITIPDARFSHKGPDLTVSDLTALVQDIVAEKEGGEA